MSGGRVLVAGVGNIFLGDDGFGVETVGRLRARPLPEDVEVVDFGVRGVHLAYQLLDGYRTLILVDATMRGGPPGTVYLIEADAGPVEAADAALLDGHRMGPDAVLALLATLSAGTGGTPPGRILVVGCEPESLEEGIGLSPAVDRAADHAVDLILRTVEEDRTPGERAEQPGEPATRHGEPAERPGGRAEQPAQRDDRPGERADRADRKASPCGSS
ncbi:hydrogenase maturation protease [Kitasatospora sp. NPDC058170]|uniref:hydrogenase maturation protease n=1 Tax=Kitasatospora sp. NPDC058170 TaxID=3346364 RepID=UPI0036D900E7